MYSVYSLILKVLIQTINLTMFMHRMNILDDIALDSKLKLTTRQPTNKAHLHFFQRLILLQKRQKSFGFFRPKKKITSPSFFYFWAIAHTIIL